MAYNITLTNGNPLVTVADGTTDPKVFTSLTLVGKNYAGYGLFLNENFVQLLENFANTTEPPNALEGQIWWDTTNKVLKVRNGANWKSVSGSTSSATTPVNPTSGDLWWDTGNSQLKVWGGTVWVVIGPSYTATTGHTGIDADVVLEAGGGQSHIVVKFFVNNVVVAILSNDPPFVIQTLAGFGTINPGFTLSTNNSLAYYGPANNALNLGGVAATNYLRSDIAGAMQGALSVLSNTGVAVGTAGDFTTSVTSTSTNLTSAALGKDLNFYVNLNGTSTKLLALNGTNGSVLLSGDPTVNLGAATKQYVDVQLTGNSSPLLKKDGTNAITGNILPAVNAAYNFGSASSVFNNIYANNFVGTASNSSQLGGVASTSYVRNDVSSPVNTAMSINNNAGLTIGTSGDFTINVTSSPNAVNLKGNTSGKGMIFSVNVAGTPTNVISVDGATGLATVFANPTANLGIATKQYVDAQIGGGVPNLTAVTTNITPNANNTLNIGSGSAKWNTVYATTFAGNASTANYADLAERFEADTTYAPGTVVEMGGSAEVTSVVDDLSENVFGVISTQAAYLMNAGAGTDATHPPIAMQGRVPVRVVGKVTKGDRLVSAGNGMARAASRSEITPYNVIGRSLVNKLTAGEGTVEAIVKLNS